MEGVHDLTRGALSMAPKFQAAVPVSLSAKI
jgi:hypothetical protein